MKIALIVFIIWSILLFCYAVSATVMLSEENEKQEMRVRNLEKECERLMRDNDFYKKRNMVLEMEKEGNNGET